MLKQAQRSTHDTSRDVTSRLARHNVLVVLWRVVTWRNKWNLGLYVATMRGKCVYPVLPFGRDAIAQSVVVLRNKHRYISWFIITDWVYLVAALDLIAIPKYLTRSLRYESVWIGTILSFQLCIYCIANCRLLVRRNRRKWKLFTI